MVEVMKEIDYIQKDKTNTFDHYEYASEKAVKISVRPILVKHRVVPQINITSLKTIILENSKQPIFTEAMFDYAFWDADSGECLKGTFAGSGQDRGDKALYKAITGAIKYMLTSELLIVTGDDPENDSQEEPPKKASNNPVVDPTYEDPFFDPPPKGVATGMLYCDVAGCGGVMKERKGAKGSFLGCSKYPTCKNTKSI